MAQVLTDQTTTAPAVRAWSRLLRAHSTTKRLVSAELQAEHGLTVNDYEALLVLSRTEQGYMKRVDLSRTLMLTPSGVTRLLDGLEEAGLVESMPCPSDKRVTYAAITESGRQKVSEAASAHNGAIQALLGEHLTQKEIDTVAAILGKLPGVAEGDESCTPG
jgi:DNA-binding MarR family transcriptional regulator